ncbi:MAG: topoisomerase DNA-binding C4 zinc finger domain-containing protein [Phycisphaerae bacterium]
MKVAEPGTKASTSKDGQPGRSPSPTCEPIRPTCRTSRLRPSAATSTSSSGSGHGRADPLWQRRARESARGHRPTDVTRTPQALAGHLTDEQLKLYTLIWNRFVACQMSPAEWDTTTARIVAKTSAGAATFKASGRVLVFDGFYRVIGVPEGDQILPALQEKQAVAPIELTATQKFTAPPPRFTEASLVKELETQGIGRPSTYANIIQTIQGRGYVEQEDRRFRPTARGELVTKKLVEHFPKIMDVQFTSFMEEELDKIESAHLDWVHVLHEFYDPFKESLGKAHQEMQPVRAEPSNYTCERCGKAMVYRFGRDGRFLACTGYPDCTNAQDIDRDGKPLPPVKTDAVCERCGKPMQFRRSKRGPFLGCTGYPDCDFTHPCDEHGVRLKRLKPEEITAQCPECGGEMGVRFARGRAFMGCKKYPECKGTSPVPEGIHVDRPPPEQAGVPCDKCGRPMVIRKSRRGPFLSCSGFPRCRNAKPMDQLENLRKLAESGLAPTPPPEGSKSRGGSIRGRADAARSRKSVDVSTLGPPPPGFAWTRTGRPVVEVLPASGESLSCPECRGEMTLKSGRFGPFFGCNKCRATANLRGEAKKQAEAAMPAPDRPKPIPTDVACPDCGGKMLLRMGRTGRFLGCGNYPKCKKTMEVPPGLLREVAAAAE